MDTFFEQIIAVKKNGKAVAAIIGIWLAAFIVCFLLIMFMGFLGTFSLLLAAGALFGAYKLCTRFNLEYEYIVTNGTMDIDKIINKSSRKSFCLDSSSNRTHKWKPICSSCIRNRRRNLRRYEKSIR